jgi:tRNA threonylcarbamoyladenosine biosynthesis protein TsaE
MSGDTEFLADEAATLAFGGRLAAALRGDELIFLEGDLGMGKTTLVRGLLRGLGYSGSVKSPTYTLIEPYEFDGWRIYHLDLYRIADPAELEFIGLDELMEERAIVLVEWPDRAPGAFRNPDRRFRFRPQGEGRIVET